MGEVADAICGALKRVVTRGRRLTCSCRGLAPKRPLQRGYRYAWRDRTGVTLGWSGYPEVAVASGYECTTCGAVYEISDCYIPGIAKRDQTGWPLTLSGERMPIESDGEWRERDHTMPPHLCVDEDGIRNIVPATLPTPPEPDAHQARMASHPSSRGEGGGV